ncbi:MAG: hypothetical protein JSV44_00210, partial [Candidatus Zixiibacteriota bacterium]
FLVIFEFPGTNHTGTRFSDGSIELFGYCIGLSASPKGSEFMALALCERGFSAAANSGEFIHVIHAGAIDEHRKRVQGVSSELKLTCR